MILYPVTEKTIVSNLSSDELIRQLMLVTSAPALSKKDIEPNSMFLGNISRDEFSISLKLNSPNNFIPLIKGIVDSTKQGSIVYLKYELFFSSKMFLVLWSFIGILITLFFLFVIKNHAYAAISIFFTALNYAITIFYFAKNVDESHSLLLEALKKPQLP